MNVVTRAQQYAHAAHDSIQQVRKYTGESYWVHTDEVASIVSGVTQNPSVIAAAHLHDVLEDVPAPEGAIYSSEHLRATFGSEIYILVRHLTDVFVTTPLGVLNRAQRKELERYRLSMCPATVQTIKLADLISNTRSIVEQDSKFAKTYMAEKRAMVAMLHRGDASLRQRAEEQIEAYYESIH